MSIWDDEAEKLIEKLSQTEEEADVIRFAGEVVEKIRNHYDKPNSRKKPLATIRKAVEAAYPSTDTEEFILQYFTDKGEGHIERYQHVALKYLTLSTEEWDALGNDAREEWKAQQAEKTEVLQPTETEKAELEESETVKSTKKQTVKTTKKQITLNDMDISSLELDADIQEMVQTAIAHLDITFADFIRRASEVYAKTIIGKVKLSSEDLTAVSTQDLKSDSYKTHPGRADELARRAIYALEMHNNTCTEKAQKWHLNQTAIQALTGSKPATIKAILENYQIRLDDHNAKHDLNPYDNRKGGGRKIDLEIDLVALVPDGLDVT
ncbi:hypothetical protein [Nostoc commune]|uniref:hypothetical protein n=1 Tax=Nostoc commune TaxID=1178 RepID=UPI0018C6E967|nr:hypothetical protein [Nostoc commune]MBG1258426.1 hypothetical protein [Nostoc commune BAE]